MKKIFLLFIIILIITGCSSKLDNSKENNIENKIDETIIQENKKKMISCLENELGGYITTEKSEFKDIPLSEITNKEDKIQYYKGLQASSYDMYIIYENTPSEFEVLKDFELYISKKYSIYQKYSFNNGINVLIHNALNDINFKEIERKCNINYYKPDKTISIPNKILESLNDTSLIIIKSGTNRLGTIENKDTISNTLDIINTSYQYSYNKINEGYLCDNYAFEFEMYNKKGKLLNTIYIWHDGKRLIPKNLNKGCSYYNITSNKDIRKIIEEETNYIFYNYSNYEEECNKDLELIYEDKEYNYYLKCTKSDNVLIHFDISNLTMNIKYALNNNYINIDQLVLYDNLMVKEKK